MNEVIYDWVVQLVGTPVPGLEPVVYVISCVVLLFLLDTAFAVLGAVIRTATGN